MTRLQTAEDCTNGMLRTERITIGVETSAGVPLNMCCTNVMNLLEPGPHPPRQFSSQVAVNSVTQCFMFCWQFDPELVRAI